MVVVVVVVVVVADMAVVDMAVVDVAIVDMVVVDMAIVDMTVVDVAVVDMDVVTVDVAVVDMAIAVVYNKFILICRLISVYLELYKAVQKMNLATSKELDIISDTISSIDDIFLVVIVGEFNSGKSTLINSLLGSDYLKTGILPTTVSHHCCFVL